MTKFVFSFGNNAAEGDPSRRDLLGGKGAGLAEMTALGLPVPPGFTLSTEACTLYARDASLSEALRTEVREALRTLETRAGKRFGDPSGPLLVSVRSGARASMPGMMDTILNLGLNDVVVEGLAKKTENPRFAYDAYRRFITMFATVALGLPREPFDDAFEHIRLERAGAKGIDTARTNREELRRQFPDHLLEVDDLKALTNTFKGIVRRETGAEFPHDPEDQLWKAISAVFSSWNNPRAKFYRAMHAISDSWGTACNVQAMVFGNLGNTSATGVAFTRNPSTGVRELFGEWLPNAQGEDVVAGIRTPLPLRGPDTSSLELSMPEPFKQLARVAETLETKGRDMQDLEFTIQEGTLYMLQCRAGKRTARAALRIAVDMVKENAISKDEAILRVDPAALDQLLHPTLDPKAPKTLLARGLAASPGAATGQIVFDADEAQVRAGQGHAVILVRTETSPEDIHGMKAARGILTARGGMTSHAAVVARGMGKPCVAGCSAIHIRYEDQTMVVTTPAENGAKSETLTFKKGDTITLDGASGHVYAGAISTVPASLGEDFDEFMAWADARRTLKVRANADTPHDATTARNFGAEGIGLCRTEHMFFEEDRISVVREMILAQDLPTRERALAKLLPMQREDFVGIFRAMDGLPVTIRLLDPPLHEFLPHEDAQIEALAQTMQVSAAVLTRRTRELHEHNPMLGHRGCRLAVTYPEIYAMQTRAVLEAARIVFDEGLAVHPEIMIPLAVTREELEITRKIVNDVAADVAAKGKPVPFLFGTMIELPRAAIVADELAEEAEFFSFGTNDLTQATLGLSRDDAGKFLPAYVEAGILPNDPFVSLDQKGVGPLVSMAFTKGRAKRANLKVGVCGEHGGDPASIGFFHTVGLDYVSCSPFRVVIARLSAAHAAVRGTTRESSTL